MSKPRFMEEFKLEAIKQITEHRRPVAEVAKSFWGSTHSLYAWIKQYCKSAQRRENDSAETAELRRLH